MRVTKTRASISSQNGAITLARPPRSQIEGGEPYVKGSNILMDPGFEAWVDGTGGWLSDSPSPYERPDGVSTYTLPQLDLTCPAFKRWGDGTCAASDLGSWAQGSGPVTSATDLGEDAKWHVSTVDPQAGDYNAAWWRWNEGNGGVPSDLCVLNPLLSAPFSARVEPGDAITWSGYSYVWETTGTPTIQPTVRFYNSSSSIIGITLGTQSNLTTSYAQYSVSTNAPPGSRYVRVCFQFAGGADNERWVLFDSAVLSVT